MEKKEQEQKEYLRWIKMGKDDFYSAKVNYENKKYYICSYLCQQSAEKVLKALIIKNNNELIKTHNLVYLGGKVNLPNELMKFCDELSLIFVETKYGITGGGVPSQLFSKTDSKKHLNYAKEVLLWVEKNI